MSARKVGPNVYTRDSAQAAISACNCPETVNPTSVSKNSLCHFVFFLATVPLSPSSFVFFSVPLPCSCVAAVSDITLNCSPAPSQSDEVRTGVLTSIKPFSSKYWRIEVEAACRTRNNAPNVFVRGRRWGISRRNSNEWRFFASGYTCEESYL